MKKATSEAVLPTINNSQPEMSREFSEVYFMQFFNGVLICHARCHASISVFKLLRFARTRILARPGGLGERGGRCGKRDKNS